MRPTEIFRDISSTLNDSDMIFEHVTVVAWAIAVALVIIAVIKLILWQDKRPKELHQWAKSKGWAFDPSSHRDYDRKYPEFYRLHDGHTRRVKNVVHGQVGNRTIEAFDFTYEKGHGDDETSYAFSAVIISPGFAIKPLLIRAERFTDKLAAIFGGEDINFESEEFNRRFLIKSPDRKWAYDVIHHRMMEFLMSLPGDHIIQFDYNSIFITRGQTRWDIAQFEDAINVLNKMIDLFPNYLSQEAEEKS